MTRATEEFRMPSLGSDMVAGRVVQWHKAPGDRVRRGDIIAEVDTDKGAIDIEVFTDGTLARILVPEGERAEVGTPLALIEVDAPGASAAPAAPAAAETEARAKVTPVARRFAAERGVDLRTLRGTGPGGAITLGDVEAAAGAAAAGTGPAAAMPRVEEEPSAVRLRRAIAAAMSRSKREIPHYYLTTAIDLGAAVQWLTERNGARPPGERLLMGALQLKAVALALRDFPQLNAWWVDDAALAKPSIHVGVAISLRGGGLVAPAIHDTDRLGLEPLMAAMRDLVSRARGGGLKSSELSDGTITVTSLGERGVDAVIGVIYPPQVALVGFGRMAVRPWVVGGRLEARPVVTASFSGDHRASDGHTGALFLARVEQLLQEPAAL